MSQFDAISSYLPPGDGYLPKWLLFVSRTSSPNQTKCRPILTSILDLRRLPRQQHPIVHIPRRHSRCLQRHSPQSQETRRCAGLDTPGFIIGLESRDGAQRAYVWNLDGDYVHHQAVRCLSYQ
jgi:hypothetical protein